MGVYNGALLAGIAISETGLAHCNAEVTYGCPGPASSSCGGGPVIAGASDGPCSAEQGGLGMFQVDSGTFSQTISVYGPNIVTIQGNVDAVIPFLVTRAKQSVPGITTDAEALAWMNSIKIQDGDAEYEEWLYFVAWRYNGCMGCTTQINKYRAGTNTLRDEFGPGFWTIATTPPEPCAKIPADGRVIDETDACFEKGGGVTSWYTGDTGMGGTCLFTYTTDDPAADNHATWTLDVETDGTYAVEVYTDASLAQTKQAKYTVTHDGGTTDVLVDQSAMTGWQLLGEFDLRADTPGTVSLGDNTGEPYVSAAKIAIMFDAVKVSPTTAGPGGDGDGDGDPDDPGAGEGGCSAGGGGASFGLALGLLALVRRRRA
jgi:uncharacterized protein (TIGR03382 family)